ncbi:APC family permease [Rhabdothermincola salaria]|uniref:APC family permease n=1 Tax=Rhabdothermincola salaria TaxID=2903142 RepID=UPI001E453827|nr:APC family permease [Rhabdothermincola salaria]
MGLTFVAVGGVIGSGWLFGPLFAAQFAGPSSILAWVFGGLMVMIAALTFAEIAAMLPVMGGLGRLPQFSHGRTVGTMIGWTAWVGYVTAAPIETQALLEYVSNEDAFGWLFTGDGSDGQNPLSTGGLAVAAGLLAAFTVVNAYGVRLFARVNTPLTWFKIAVPLVAAVALLTRFDADNLTSQGFAPEGVRGVMAAISSGGVIFAFLGFRHALDMAGEARRPQRTVPIALTASLAICIVIFVLVQLGFVGALSASDLTGGWGDLDIEGANGPVAGVLAGLGMAVVANLVLADAVAGPLGAGLVASASTARLSVAVSRNGLFPRAIRSMSRHGVPLRALVLNTMVGFVILVAFRDGWREILTFNAGAIVLSFAAGPVTLLALRRQIPDRPRPFRLPAVNLVASVAFVVVGLIVYWTGWDTLWKLMVPLAVGAVLYAWQVVRRPDERSQLDLAQAWWLAPYYGGLLAISYAGNFDGGRALVPFGWDVVLVAAFSLAVLPLAVRARLPDDEARRYIAEDDDEQPPDDPPSTATAR